VLGGVTVRASDFSTSGRWFDGYQTLISRLCWFNTVILPWFMLLLNSKALLSQ